MRKKTKPYSVNDRKNIDSDTTRIIVIMKSYAISKVSISKVPTSKIPAISSDKIFSDISLVIMEITQQSHYQCASL